MINKIIILNEAKYLSLKIFQDYLICVPTKNTLNILVTLLGLNCENLMKCQKKVWQGLHDTTLIAEAKYPINFTQPNKRFLLSLQYNESNRFLFVNPAKIYQFKAKKPEVKDYALCLGNISKYFTINNMKKPGLVGVVKFFSVDFIPIDTNDILDIH